ncbi:hypothetical protein L1049_002558 [Liquidambar formosana]|uniref:Uncharacterized protein n=1 Tax=Liquidambar formosana TaxID=63359 RepID=A0AAP0R6T5_LIQFO
MEHHFWTIYKCPMKIYDCISEKRFRHRKSRLIERIEVQEFSIGCCPPSLGLHGTRWSTSGDQRILHMGFDWDTNDLSIILLAKLAKPLVGTARIVINNIHIKGDVFQDLKRGFRVLVGQLGSELCCLYSCFVHGIFG